MQKNLAYSIILTSLIILISACSGDNKDEKDKKKKFAIPVVTSSIKQATISSTYHSTATLESRNDAQVISRVTGIIEHLTAEEGDYVEKGQLLAKIDSRRYQLSLNKAQAELASLNLELSRLKKLHARKLVSSDQIDKLSFSKQSATAARDLAALDLQDSQIKAPITGFISQKMAKKGHFTQSYQQLFHIVNQQDLQAVLYVPEAQLANVKLNQLATLTFSALPSKKFTANVRSISPIVDHNSGTFKVILSLANEKSLLKPGMFAQISVVFDTHHNALTIPNDAIVYRDGQKYLFVIKGKKAIEIPIATGFVQEQLTEIISDIALNSEVVIQGHRNLKHKALIEVINKPAVKSHTLASDQ